MAKTNIESLWLALWPFKDHGKSFEAVYERDHHPGFRWVIEAFGTNWRTLEMHAAIGRIQLRRLSEWTEQRAQNAQAIWDVCRSFAALRVPAFACEGCRLKCDSAPRAQGCVHANYKCYVYLKPAMLKKGWSRDRVIQAIEARGVPCYQGSCSGVYLEKAFDGTGWRPPERLPVARELGDTALMFLVHPTLTKAEVEKTCNGISQVMLEASR